MGIFQPKSRKQRLILFGFTHLLAFFFPPSYPGFFVCKCLSANCWCQREGCADVHYIRDVLLVPELTKWEHRAQLCPCLPTGIVVSTRMLTATPHLKLWQKCDLGWGSSQVQGPSSVLVMARQLPCKPHHVQNSLTWQNAIMQILHVCSANRQIPTSWVGLQRKNHQRNVVVKKVLRKFLLWLKFHILRDKSRWMFGYTWEAERKRHSRRLSGTVHKFCNYRRCSSRTVGE